MSFGLEAIVLRPRENRVGRLCTGSREHAVGNEVRNEFLRFGRVQNHYKTSMIGSGFSSVPCNGIWEGDIGKKILEIKQ